MPKRESIRVDRDLTARRFGDGTYQDVRSRVHQDGKEYLAGVDVGRRRREVWERDERRCVKCLAYVTFERFEMHHVAKNYGAKRFDNLSNLQTLCCNCHRGPGGKHA